MLRVPYRIFFSALFLPLAAASLSFGSTSEGTILRVIDGDSLWVNEGGNQVNVRLIGIDAPEAEDNPKAEQDASENHQSLASVIASGKEAENYLKNLVHTGEVITLVTDVQTKDAYGRLLAYVYLSDGKLLNEKIVRAGFAVPLAIAPDIKYRKEFESAYESALKGKRGLWSALGSKGLVLKKRRGKKWRYHYWRRARATPVPWPQTDVTDQKNVSDQNEVSGKTEHFK